MPHIEMDLRHTLFSSDQSMADVKAGRRLSIMFRDAIVSADALVSERVQKCNLRS